MSSCGFETCELDDSSIISKHRTAVEDTDRNIVSDHTAEINKLIKSVNNLGNVNCDS